MKRLLENACIWFLTRHREYTVYKNRQPSECIPNFVKVLRGQNE
ncbi:MAG: hypothetical protein Q4A60_06555 [Pasteurellaceae bacterium]|nr:hypothetical protein [Pasteurellaceae bacterium]